MSGLVRILHQRLGYHMTKVTYIFYCGYILPTYIYLYIYGYTINQLIPPLYWFSITHKSSPLHVLLSSNLDSSERISIPLSLHVCTPAARLQTSMPPCHYTCSAPPSLHSSISPRLQRASRSPGLYTSISLCL